MKSSSSSWSLDLLRPRMLLTIEAALEAGLGGLGGGAFDSVGEELRPSLRLLELLLSSLPSRRELCFETELWEDLAFVRAE